MENRLSFGSKPLRFIFPATGILIILSGIAFFLSHTANPDLRIYVLSLIPVVAGSAAIIFSSRLAQSYFVHDSDMLTIKLSNRLSPVNLKNTEIKQMRLHKDSIELSGDDGRLINIDLKIFEAVQKKQLYDFFITYSSVNNLSCLREF